jgi:hypothetical protein
VHQDQRRSRTPNERFDNIAGLESSHRVRVPFCDAASGLETYVRALHVPPVAPPLASGLLLANLSENEATQAIARSGIIATTADVPSRYPSGRIAAVAVLVRFRRLAIWAICSLQR